MKNRLNITIDEALAEQAKRFAEKHGTSVSQLVEQYFRNLTRPVQKRNILDLLKEMTTPEIKIGKDWKKDYYRKQKKKYGF